MAFDEKGQADTVERKVEICARSFKILTQEVGVPPGDIIFATGILVFVLFIFGLATGHSLLKERPVVPQPGEKKPEPVA